MVEIVGFAWVAAGVGFWAGALAHNGAPSSWRSQPREPGWGQLLAYLLVSAIFGPLLWLIMATARRRST